MDRDRNLLFGILAVQLRQITAQQLVEAAALWVTNPARDLSRWLVDAGALSETDSEFVADIVNRIVRAHHGDVTITLDAFGGEKEVYRSFQGTITLTPSGGVRSIAPLPDGFEWSVEDAPGVQEAPGRYRSLGEHARGGMGRVLVVRDEHLGRDIALKELLPAPKRRGTENTPGPGRRSVQHMARFLQEARITGQLEHPSIVPVHELGYRKDGTLYYTMKLVRGKTLSKAIREAGNLRDRLKLMPHFVGLCQAIAYSHSRKVIHRDIKPQNVMVGEFGETVVLDWGLAKVKGREDVHEQEMVKVLRALRLGSDSNVVNTAYGEAMGTPAYMAPEQARGELDQVDEHSDVYSLGAVLYELIAGRPPFEGASVHEIIEKVIEQEPPPISAHAPDAPPELTAICARAMRKEPSKRYASAGEFAEDVQRFLAGALVQAYQYRVGEHVRRFTGRHRAVLSIGTLAILLILGLGVVFQIGLEYVRDRAIKKQQTEAEVARPTQEPQESQSQARAEVEQRIGMR